MIRNKGTSLRIDNKISFPGTKIISVEGGCDFRAQEEGSGIMLGNLLVTTAQRVA